MPAPQHGTPAEQQGRLGERRSMRAGIAQPESHAATPGGLRRVAGPTPDAVSNGDRVAALDEAARRDPPASDSAPPRSG